MGKFAQKTDDFLHSIPRLLLRGFLDLCQSLIISAMVGGTGNTETSELESICGTTIEVNFFQICYDVL